MSELRDYHIRDIMAMSIEERMMLPDGGLRLTFDDDTVGVFKTRSTIISSMYWDLVTLYPGLTIKQMHHMGNGHYTADTHNELGSLVFWHAYFASKNQTQEQVWSMTRELYNIANRQYNIYAKDLTPWISTMAIDDMMEIFFHPVTIEAKKRYLAGEYTIQECHDVIYSLMTSDRPELKRNQVRCACVAGLLSQRQIKQMIGPRGAIPDVNGETFEYPVMPGYVEGLSTFYDSFTETRTASIALYATSSPLEASEYNNRQCQLACSVIRNVTYGNESDCGGDYYLNMFVDETLLPTLTGKYMITDDDELKLLTGREKALLGKIVKIRSFTKCNNDDPQSVCLTCIGQNGLTIPPGTNAGHHLSIEPQDKISQTILSTKHVIASAVALALDMEFGNRRMFLMQDEDDQFKVQLKKTDKHQKIRIDKDYVQFINDVFSVDDVKDLRINAISDVNEIQVCNVNPETGDIGTIDRVSLEVSGKGSPLAHDFLAYIKEKRWDIVGRYIEIDMGDWDYEKDLVRTNPISEDIMALFNAFKTFLHAPEKTLAPRITDYRTVEDAISALAKILTTKLKVNFTHLEVFVRPLMCRGDTGYMLPKPDEPFRFVSIKEVLQHRGMGNALAYQEQAQLLTDPEVYNRAFNDIPSTPLDDLWDNEGIMPGQ